MDLIPVGTGLIGGYYGGFVGSVTLATIGDRAKVYLKDKYLIPDKNRKETRQW